MSESAVIAETSMSDSGPLTFYYILHYFKESAYLAYLWRNNMAEKENMTNLCKEALKILANKADPITLIQDAKEKAATRPGDMRGHNDEYGKKLGYPSFFHDFTEYKGWKIVQHNLTSHYALLDSDGIVRTKFYSPDLLKALIELAPNDEYEKKKKTMIIYHLVTNTKVDIYEDCEGLTVKEAYEKFPHSKDLASGFFTNNPFNELSLIPVEHYFANIVLNRDDECVVLLGKMGAKSVQITKFDGSKTKGGGKGEAGISEINARVGMSISNELQNFSELIVKFQGHVSDISPDILNNSVWFQNDSQMKSILEGRSSPNKITEYDMVTGITQKFNFDFTAAANVLHVAKASLEIEYEKATKQTRKFHVIFGE